MSRADVTFHTLANEPCAADQKPARFSFRCPFRNRGRHPDLKSEICDGALIANAGHGIKRDGQGNNGGRPQWDWDGNAAEPTFRPSVNCGRCGWHGYIRKGRCVTGKGVDEPE